MLSTISSNRRPSQAVKGRPRILGRATRNVYDKGPASHATCRAGAGVGYEYARAAHSVDFSGRVFGPGADVLDSPYVLRRCGHSHGWGIPRSRDAGDESGGGTPRCAGRTWVPGCWQRRVIPDWLGADSEFTGIDC